MDSAAPASGTLRDTRYLFALLVAATALAVLSIWAQGFRVGVSNNIFHIPFVLRWDQQPGFAGDAFYQTLPGFTSGILWLLRQFATEESLGTIFLTLHVLCRIGTFLALGWLLRPLLPNATLVLVALLAIAGAPGVRGVSAIGEHDMLLDFFTHTELAWPFVILALTCATARRWAWAAGWSGLVFCINAFVGLWIAFAVTALIVFARDQARLRTGLRALYVFGVVALPVAVWMYLAVDGQRLPSEAFSFRQYVREYYPQHFLIEAAPAAALLNAVAMAGLAVVVCIRLQWRQWPVVVAALLVLMSVGAVLPYLWDHRFVFNLHLLRADGVLSLICQALLAAASLRFMTSPDLQDRWRGGGLIVGCLTGQWTAVALAWVAVEVVRADRIRVVLSLALAILLGVSYAAGSLWLLQHPELGGTLAFSAASLLLASATPPSRWGGLAVAALSVATLAVLLAFARAFGGLGLTVTLVVLLGLGYLLLSRHAASLLQRPLPVATLQLAAVAVVALGAGITVAAERQQTAHATLTTADRDWIAMTRWFRVASSPGPVLIPLRPAGVGIDHNFQLNARTPVWVDLKQGAAVMWAPAFHDTWAPRRKAVERLRTPDDYLRYAQQQRIGLFISQRHGKTLPACPTGSTGRYANASFGVCAPTAMRE